jgi:hypothetical protein
MSFLNKRVEESIKQAKLSAQMSEMSYRAMRSGRGGRCVAGWLSVCGLFAMQCAARGLVAFAGCAALHTGCDAMRCDARDAMRCELVAMQCAKASGFSAGWLHSRGAGGAMLFSFAIEGFLGCQGMGGWVEGWVDGWDGWAVCEVYEVWADRWPEGWIKTKGFI